jgi:hypothetical protein
MDDRHAHFLTMLGDTCVAAGLARLSVELVLGDGRRVSGTPSPLIADQAHPPVDETGYSSRLLIDGEDARLEDVVEFVVRAP